MKKKILSLVLVCAMLMALVPSVSAAEIVASGNCGTYNYNTQQFADNAKWMLNSEGTLTVSGTGSIGSWFVSNGAQDYKNDIKKLIIEDGITGIGAGAFNGCKNLAEIDIPDSVMRIESNVFYATTWYNNQPFGSVYVGKVLYDYKFDKSKKENITLKIREGTVSISNTLDDWAYFSGSEDFEARKRITNIEFPDSLKMISARALDCTGWYTKQPDGVVYVNDILYAYKSGMTEPQNIHIKDGTTTICPYAFHSGSGYPICDKMTAVYIPTSLQTVYEFAFLECDSLTDIYYAGTKEQWNNSTITVFTDENGNDAFMNASVHFLGIASTPKPTPVSTPFPTPKPTSAPQCFTVSGSRVTNTAATAQTAAVIIAKYSGNRLTDVASQKITFAANEAKTFTVPSGGKLFVWNSVSGMQPLTK